MEDDDMQSFCFTKHIFTAVILCALSVLSCRGEKVAAGQAAEDPGIEGARLQKASAVQQDFSLPQDALSQAPEDLLEQLAEQERSGGFKAGDGMRESAIREQSGDYAGAVLAAFKELYWAYTFVQGEERISAMQSAIETGLTRVNDAFVLPDDSDAVKAAAQAVDAALAFFYGRFGEAEVLLAALADDGGEPDSFLAWMKLVCALENAAHDENALRNIRPTYSAMRSRYETLPAYWYFGARNMKGSAIPAYAERAINLSPDGPYAKDARVMIAQFTGLPPADGKAIMTKYEIETVVAGAVEAKQPALLAGLFPLAGLPDNPYTLYTVGIMRALVSDVRFKTYFEEQLQSVKSGKQARLAERLVYIIRG
jgi:hypothetical protein